MSDDRSCSCNQYYEKSFYRHGKYHRRRRSYHPCFSADPGSRPCDPGCRNHFLCLFHGSGWAYYGERCVEYFSGKKGLIPYRILYVLVAAIAPVISLNLVWTVADILNALMAIPNLIAVLLLSNVIVSETKKYIHDLDARDDTPIEIIDK